MRGPAVQNGITGISRYKVCLLHHWISIEFGPGSNGLHQRIGAGLESQRYRRAACVLNLLIKIRIAHEHPIDTVHTCVGVIC
ncbi:hypothetical protein T11_17687 [Trichinella zimbabwensis]|uniref:Uncharacterized protein n=1 Tax=Trichinella zimbabwensis TaxID=268475 RepID=A0A0V1GZN7_9BILA|nr:hypothetical protein T11_17687 [Trichinella zimbabwensis]